MWYYDGGGKKIGPVSDVDMRQFAASGGLGASTLVWREDFAGWLAAEQTELASVMAPGTALTVSGRDGLMIPVDRGMPPPLPLGALASGLELPYRTARFAGFWIRVLAYILDSIIVQVASLVVGGVIGLMFGAAASSSETSQSIMGIVSGMVGLLLGFGYYIAFLCSRWQATPGKRIVGVYVVCVDGRMLDFGTALGRQLSYIISSLILGIGFFMIGWTDQKTGLHDKICQTRVVYGRR